MKNIYKLILSLAAILTLAPSVNAQNLAEGTYLVTDGVAFRKSVSGPDPESGEYTIKIESFVTGEAGESQESQAADIVLVLDVSGSMSESIQLRKNKEWTVNDINTFPYDLYYYEGSSTARRVVTDGNEIGYNTGRWPNITWHRLGTNTWTGELRYSLSKINALEDAVESFIEEIDYNDLNDPEKGPRTERLGNQLAIVTFSGWGNGSGDTDTQYATEVIGLTPFGSDKSITDDSGKQLLLSKVDFNADGGTYVEHGTELAKSIISTSEAKLKTVVVFTDGVPGNGYWPGEFRYDGSSLTSANRAIADANAMKEDGVTVWAVGVFGSGSNNAYTKRYMSRVSSDWGSNAPNMSDTDDSGSIYDQYFINVSDGEDLNSVFETIAQASGGSLSPASGTSTVAMDIVSNSFALPANIVDDDGNIDYSRVKLYTEKCIGKNNGYLLFGDRKEAPNREAVTYYYLDVDEDNNPVWKQRTADIDNNISASKDPSIDNAIRITGFPYSELFCGYDSKHKEYRGYKLVVEFPIEIAEDALGGAEVITNTEESGLYLNDSEHTFIPFNRPTAAVPVNLQLLKEGMEEGDVAHFTIERKLASDPNSAYAYYTTITLVGDPNNEVTKTFTDSEGNQASATGVLGVLRGLDPLYHYRIKEAGWAWTYDNQDRTQMSTEERDENPFVVKNDPDDPEIHNKEVSRRNVFTTTKVLVSPSN